MIFLLFSKTCARIFEEKIGKAAVLCPTCRMNAAILRHHMMKPFSTFVPLQPLTSLNRIFRLNRFLVRKNIVILYR